MSRFAIIFNPGCGAETRRKRHPGDHGQPHRLHPPGGRLQAEQADQAPLPGLQTGLGQRGQPGVAAHVRPAGDPGERVQEYSAAESACGSPHGRVTEPFSFGRC